MANMSISDLLLGLFVCLPGMVAAIVESWPFSSTMCQITGIINGMSISVSLWSLTGISVERFLVVVQPVHVNHQPRLRSVQLGIVFIWTFNTLFYAMPVFVRPDMRHYIYQKDLLVCGFVWDPTWVLYLASALYPIVPGLIIIVCSCRIVMTIQKQNKIQVTSSLESTDLHSTHSYDQSSVSSSYSPPDQINVAATNTSNSPKVHLTVPGNHRNLDLYSARPRTNVDLVHTNRSAKMNAKIRREAKASKVMIVTAIAFFACTSPYLCTSMVDKTQDVVISDWHWFSAMWLLNCNSFINVFIYSTIYVEFRNLFIVYFVPSCFKQNNRP